MREQFEKLPEIAELLKDKNKSFFFNDDFEVYGINHKDDFDMGYINGAWYAFQEQQKIINNVYSIIHDAYMGCPEDSVKGIYDKIEDLLK